MKRDNQYVAWQDEETGLECFIAHDGHEIEFGVLAIARDIRSEYSEALFAQLVAHIPNTEEIRSIMTQNHLWRDMPDYGDVMTIQEWLSTVNGGGFIDYDGWGYLSDGKRKSSIGVVPSDVTRRHLQFPDWATHVVWFNR